VPGNNQIQIKTQSERILIRLSVLQKERDSWHISLQMRKNQIVLTTIFLIAMKFKFYDQFYKVIRTEIILNTIKIQSQQQHMWTINYNEIIAITQLLYNTVKRIT